MLCVLGCGPSVALQVSEHGSAGIDENAGADRKALVCLEGEDLARALAVVEQAQVVQGEVVDWQTVPVGGVEDDADLIDCDGEGVRSGVSAGRRSAGHLRNTERRYEDAEMGPVG